MWFPGLWRIAAWRVNRQRARGDEEAALRTASRFFRIRPRDPNAAWLFGRVLYHSGQSAAAEEALRRASEAHPDFPELALALADELRWEGRPEEARAVLLRQRERTPRSAIPIQGLIALATSARDWDEVRSLAKEAEGLIASDDFAGRYELGVRLAEVPAARPLAQRLLREASVGLSRHGMCNLVLAVLLEETDPQDAAKHMAIARKYWQAPKPIDEVVDQVRSAITHFEPSEHASENRHFSESGD